MSGLVLHHSILPIVKISQAKHRDSFARLVFIINRGETYFHCRVSPTGTGQQNAPTQGLGHGQSTKCEEAAAVGRTVQTEEAERFADNVLPIVRSIQAAGITGMVSIAKALNDRGIRTARGGRWHVSTVRNLLDRSKQAVGA